MADVLERDWKLFRKMLPEWQERHMTKLLDEYMALLTSQDCPSEKFWALHDRIKDDKKSPGVIVNGSRRSSMTFELVQLVMDGVISVDELDGFSEDLQAHVIRAVQTWS